MKRINTILTRKLNNINKTVNQTSEKVFKVSIWSLTVCGNRAVIDLSSCACHKHSVCSWACVWLSGMFEVTHCAACFLPPPPWHPPPLLLTLHRGHVGWRQPWGGQAGLPLRRRAGRGIRPAQPAPAHALHRPRHVPGCDSRQRVSHTGRSQDRGVTWLVRLVSLCMCEGVLFWCFWCCFCCFWF